MVRFGRFACMAVVALALGACNPFATPFVSVSLGGRSLDGAFTCPLLKFAALLDGRTLYANLYPFMGQVLDGGWVYDPRPEDNWLLSSGLTMDGNWPRRNGAVEVKVTCLISSRVMPPSAVAWRNGAVEVKVTCLDEDEIVLGESHFSGRLQGRPHHPRLSVHNFEPGESAVCQQPSSGWGVTLCAEVDGFRLD